ncbi:MAG TPA: Crp/Fnr family transcriptional regulator [Allosphingosinicella sp.]|jgi:CRP-like cAMP-binding protein
MTVIAQGSCRNLLLRSLREEDFALLAPGLSRVSLCSSEVIATPGSPIEAVCFPEIGIITLSDLAEDDSRIGIGHIGYEGFIGWPALLGCDRSSHEARITAEGGIARHIAPEALREACRASETLRDLLLRFVQSFMVQMGHTIVSSLTQPVEVRLSRWTLMTHDRVDGDEIRVTHDEIAVMLAVRRASVTDALHLLEGEGLIRAQRGRVQVRDRHGLRRLAGGTYGVFETEYSRLIAPFPRHDQESTVI